MVGGFTVGDGESGLDVMDEFSSAYTVIVAVTNSFRITLLSS